MNLAYGEHNVTFKYSGDTLFDDFSETRYFNYTYIKFSVPEDENEYESTCRFFVESYVADGRLKIVLDNKTIHDDEFTGYNYIDLENLTFGPHIYDIYFTGNGKFKSIHRHGVFNRTYEFNAYFNFSYENETILIDENNLKIILPDDAASNVTVTLNNKTYWATPKSGTATVKITNLNMGENSIHITYGDEKYYKKTIVKNVFVLPSLHFPYMESGKYKRNANATLIMSENSKGTFKISIDGEEFASPLINGTASIPLDMVTVATHDFEISYTGDYEDFFENKTYENIVIAEPVNKTDWDMEFSFKVIEYYLAYVTIFMPDDLTGTQTFYFDGEKCCEYNPADESPYDYDSHWLITCETLGNTYSGLDNGTHTLTVSHSGDEKYIAKNKTVTFTKPIDGKIVSGVIITIGSDVTVQLPEGENGTAVITVNGTSKTLPVQNETTFELNLTEDLWNITVNYLGNNVNKTKSAVVDTHLKRFSLDCDDYFFKGMNKKAYLKYYYYNNEAFKSHVEILIDGKKYKGPFENEDFYYSAYETEIDLNKLTAGTHNIVINYLNDEKVITQSLEKTFKILSYSYPEITLADTSSQELNEILTPYLSISDNTTLIMNINLNGNVNGHVTVYKTIMNFYGRYSEEINETIVEQYKVFDLKNGKAKITLPTEILNSTYSLKLTINLEDGNTINESFKTYWYPKVDHPGEMIWGQNKMLTIYVPQENGTIGMFGNFKPVYAQIINGKAEIPLSTLPVANGMHVTFIFSQKYEDGWNHPYTTLYAYNLKLNIKDTSEKVNIYYLGTYSLKVSKIYGKAVKKGEIVKFKIAKTTIKVKTDKNGVAKLTLPKTVKPKTYTMTVTYKSAKLTKMLTVQHLISLKTVKVKKSAKQLVLSATLKNKKALKNKIVTFKFNGKTYTAKTSKKGIAKVKIPKSELSKLKAGKKLTYSATYLKDTVKKTVKIKK